MKKTCFPFLATKRVALLLLSLMGLGISMADAQEITFYTPRTVHVVKAKGDVSDWKSQVVIAAPEKVKVRKAVAGGTTIYMTSALTVKVEQGRVSFYNNQGCLLTAEGESTFTPSPKVPIRVPGG